LPHFGNDELRAKEGRDKGQPRHAPEFLESDHSRENAG
jgi:hypothetical protein